MVKKTKNKQNKKTNSRSKEVNRILKSNLEAGTLAKEDVFFAKRFLNVLLKEEEDLVKPGDLSNITAIEADPDDLSNPDRNQKDFENSLEPGTDPKSFDTKGITPVEDFNNEYIKKAGNWVQKLNDFAKFLNDPSSEESLNKQLGKVDRDNSVFKGITGKTVNSIVKIAGELERLGQNISGYLSQAERKTKEMHKQLTVD